MYRVFCYTFMLISFHKISVRSNTEFPPILAILKLEAIASTTSLVYSRRSRKRTLQKLRV